MKRSLETGDAVKEAQQGPPKSAKNKPELALELIGSGQMGNVYKTTYGEQTVAIKMNKDGVSEQFLRTEIHLHQRFTNSPFVVKYIMSTLSPLGLFTEYVRGGELYGRICDISTGNPYSMPEYITLIQNILTGLQHIHQARVIHRDIKPANILLDQHGNPKITDFGLSCEIPHGQDTVSTGHPVGSPDYADPESMHSPYNFSFKSDIYSLGIIMISAATGYGVYKGNANISEIKTGQQRPIINKNINEELKSIIAGCISFFSSHRTGSDELMEQLIQVDTTNPLITTK